MFFFAPRFFQSQPDNLKTDESQQEVGVKFALVMYANIIHVAQLPPIK